MKIYKWAALMELSKREVTLTMRGSHHDLVFILIGGKKKFFVKKPANVVVKRGSRKRGIKKKKRAWEGYFFKEL